MCGIYGQVSDFTESQIHFLEHQLFHRGPDERRWKPYDHINFFHARLSIVDAVGGAQPMETERYAIIFNGEIYNHLELRSRFGLRCHTRSDTETLLLLFEKLGLDMLPHLDGMFAFAIYNKHSGELVLCRDRLGEKPLYYLKDQRNFCFGSELNTIAGIHNMHIRQQSLVQFLVCGWIGPEETIYENVLQLLPGHYLKVTPSSNGQSKLEKGCWWSYEQLLASPSKRKSASDWEEELMELLKISIKRRVESSDLPVGCFLSGGLDSSIVATLSTFIKSPLPTYTFIFDGEFNEGPQAALLSEKLGTRHKEIHLNYDHLQDEIGNIILSYGEPYCDDSAIPSYYIAREAKKLNTVVINGDGGDELFGGYRRYVPLTWPKSVNALIKQVSQFAFPLLPLPKKKIDGYNYIYRLAQLSRLGYPEKYLSATTDLFTDSSFFTGANKKYVPGSMQWVEHQFVGDHNGYKEKSFSELRQFMLTDIRSLLPVVLLKKVDISTMQSSLESRTVFFTPEILQLAASLPDQLLISGKTTKVLLRRLAKKILPDNTSRLPKRGFELPLIQLMNGRLKTIVEDHLMSADASIHALISKDKVESILKRKEPVSEDRRSKMLYNLFTLEYWLKNQKSNMLQHH